MVGLESESFSILLDKDFTEEGILDCSWKVQVVEVRELYKQWYYKVLRFLTFGKYFQHRVYHKVKII